MSAVIFLDAGPLAVLSNPRKTPQPVACRKWAKALQVAGRRVIIPEIADYEVRRELLRLHLVRSITLLDGLAMQFEYLPLTTAAMQRAAELWADARRQGLPTAGDASIDADAILAAQALTLGAPQVSIATTNIIHLSRFVPGELWENIVP